MARVFENPVVLIALLLVIVVVFGANKLPGAARSIGQSMRIFRNEVRGESEKKNGASDSTDESGS
jgi:sec-independent protein translocase protein TatA